MQEFLRDLAVFRISSIFSFDILTCIVPDPRIIYKTLPSASDAAAVNLNGINKLLAHGVSTVFIVYITFIDGTRILQKNMVSLLFWTVKFLIMLCSLINYLQKP